MAEVLVVIAIIAVLMAILLPALSGAQRNVERVVCMSNLRMTAAAYSLYAADNQNQLPAVSRANSINIGDFLHWQPDRNIHNSALSRYLGGDPTGVFRCPSDDLQHRPPNQTVYKYSYVVNEFFDPSPVAGPGVDVSKYASTLSNIPRSSEKVLMYEQDPSLMDDGVGNPAAGPYKSSDLLSTRHDNRSQAEPIPQPMNPSTGWRFLPNLTHVGNASFVDGHAALVSREMLHDPRNYLPFAD